MHTYIKHMNLPLTKCYRPFIMHSDKFFGNNHSCVFIKKPFKLTTLLKSSMFINQDKLCGLQYIQVLSNKFITRLLLCIFSISILNLSLIWKIQYLSIYFLHNLTFVFKIYTFCSEIVHY